MKRQIKFVIPLIILFISFQYNFATDEKKQSNFPIEDKIPGAKESIYSSKITQVLKNWPPQYIPDLLNEPNPIWVRGIRTANHPNYIGLVKRVKIQASFEKVTNLIEEFDKYKEIFPEIVTIKITAQDNNRIWTKWERDSPAFFIPNIRYEQAYVIDSQLPDRRVYRYQLISGNSVNNSDGIIVVEKAVEKISHYTRLTAWDFFDANWGLARTFAEGLIWKKALEGSYKGDAAFLIKAEHPDWSQKQIEETTKQMMDRYPVTPIQFLENFSL